MKICQIIRRHLTVLGIEPPTSDRLLSFNRRLSLGFFVFMVAIIQAVLYFVYSANNVMEYMHCFCLVTSTTEVAFCFAAMVLQERRLFDYMETMEKLISTSKSTSNSRCNCLRTGKSDVQSNSRRNQSAS